MELFRKVIGKSLGGRGARFVGNVELMKVCDCGLTVCTGGHFFEYGISKIIVLYENFKHLKFLIIFFNICRLYEELDVLCPESYWE